MLESFPRLPYNSPHSYGRREGVTRTVYACVYTCTYTVHVHRNMVNISNKDVHVHVCVNLLTCYMFIKYNEVLQYGLY